MVGDLASEMFFNKLTSSIGMEINDNMLQVSETPVGQQVSVEVVHSSKSIINFLNDNSIPIILGLLTSIVTYSLMKVLKVENSAILEELLPKGNFVDTEVSTSNKTARDKLKSLKTKAKKQNKG